jgi:hypothetical protein
LCSPTHRFRRTTRLTELPHNLGDWCNLKRLFVTSNRLQQLPPSATALLSLEALGLADNWLRQLPSALHNLENLALVDVRGNALREVPPGLIGLTGLTDLDASGNQLAAGGLPPGLLTALTNLTALRLAGNAPLFDERRAISPRETDGQGSSSGGSSRGGSPTPPTDQQLQAQSWHDAWLQGVDTPAAAAAPKTAGFDTTGHQQLLPQLRTLDLSDTALPSLPTWLPASLTQLSVARNRLTTLPPWLCSRLAGSLGSIDLSGNSQLVRLPNELTDLVQLQALVLAGCPCASPEAAVSLRPPSSMFKRPISSGSSGCGSLPGAAVAAVPPPAEGSAAWAAGWLAARKAGRPWPPLPRTRPLPAALMAAAGVPQGRESSAGPAWQQQQQQQQAREPADRAAPPPQQPPMVAAGRRRAGIICVVPQADVVVQV